jgi:hypothetical protein
MKTSRFAFTLLVLALASGCSPDHPVPTASEQQLLRVWSMPGSSVEERAEAVNRYCRPGTPISSIITLLGTNHTGLRLTAINEKAGYRLFAVTYEFAGEQNLNIQGWAPVNTDPMSAAFDRAFGWRGPGMLRREQMRSRSSDTGEVQP